jgi:hypothetical protein
VHTDRRSAIDCGSAIVQAAERSVQDAVALTRSLRSALDETPPAS